MRGAEIRDAVDGAAPEKRVFGAGRQTMRFAHAFLLVVALALRSPSVVLAAEQPACWVVTSETTTAYLLGSIHVARPGLYPLAESIEKAFAISDVLVVEADPRGMPGAATTAAALAGLGIYPPEDSLDRHVSDAVIEAVEKRLPLPREQLVRLRPWMLAMTLTAAELAKLGITPEHGVDLHFLSRAGERRIVELESIRAQLEMLAGFDEKLQVQFLEYTLRDLGGLEQNVEGLLGAWKRGDSEALETLLFEGRRADPTLEPVYRALFDDRNLAMAKTIEGLLAGHDTIFVVVGAGHLVGPSGLVEILDERYAVTPLGR